MKKIRMSKRHWRILAIISWTVSSAIFILIGYESWFMPRGPMYDTGVETCEVSDTYVPCDGTTVKVEDLQSLDIPTWALYLRKNEMLALLFIFGLFIFGHFAYINSKPDNSSE